MWTKIHIKLKSVLCGCLSSFACFVPHGPYVQVGRCPSYSYSPDFLLGPSFLSVPPRSPISFILFGAGHMVSTPWSCVLLVSYSHFFLVSLGCLTNCLYVCESLNFFISIIYFHMTQYNVHSTTVAAVKKVLSKAIWKPIDCHARHVSHLSVWRDVITYL